MIDTTVGLPKKAKANTINNPLELSPQSSVGIDATDEELVSLIVNQIY
jgi:hypothetical protein